MYPQLYGEGWGRVQRHLLYATNNDNNNLVLSDTGSSSPRSKSEIMAAIQQSCPGRQRMCLMLYSRHNEWVSIHTQDTQNPALQLPQKVLRWHLLYGIHVAFWANCPGAFVKPKVTAWQLKLPITPEQWWKNLIVLCWRINLYCLETDWVSKIFLDLFLFREGILSLGNLLSELRRKSSDRDTERSVRAHAQERCIRSDIHVIGCRENVIPRRTDCVPVAGTAESR